MLSHSCLNQLIEFLEPVSAIVIGVIVAYIAWRQYKLERRQLQHELFDRRFAMYKAVLDLLNSIRAGGGSNLDTRIDTFSSMTEGSLFIFDSTVKSVLDELRIQAFALSDLHKEYDGLHGNDKTENVTRQRDLKDWFEQQRPKLEEHFSKFLTLK